MKERLADLKQWAIENLADLRIILIILFIATSTGHVGRLFADREISNQWFLGYILAFAIDGTLAISLYEFTSTQDKHKWAAFGVFVATCLISGGFNIAYYRLNYPSDHWFISGSLGIAAFGLAAALAMLKAMGDVEKAQEKRTSDFEIQKYEILQREETERLAEKEKTKRAKERTKQQQIKGQIEAKEEEVLQRERKGMTTAQRRKQIFDLLCQDLNQSPKDLAKRFGVTAQTIRNDLKALAKQGKIVYKDGRVSLRPQKVVEAKS